jgi:protocatechuate 3,4-dioxygenase beta subunit
VDWRAGETVLGMMSKSSDAELTGPEGLALLEALPSADVVVAVEHDEFARERRDFALLAGTEALEKSWEVTLRAGASFDGTALSNGGPVAGARVRVLPPREGSAMLAAVFDAEAEVYSDDQGGFRFERLPPGTWRLSAEHEDYARLTTENFELLEGENSARVLRLLAGGTILVTVLDENGAPVPGATVMAQETVDFQTENKVCDERGVARFEHLPPGDWRLMRVDGLSGIGPENLKLDLRFLFVELEEGEVEEFTLGGPVQRADLEGRLTMGGQPLAKHTVVLIGKGGVRSEQSGEDGSYRMDGVELGDYMINVSSGFGGGSSWFGALELRQSGTVRHDVELPSSVIEVRVIDGASGAPTAGVPVNLRPEDASSVSGGMFQHSDAEGIARFTMLVPGRYLAAVGNLAMPMLGGGESLGSTVVEGIVVASANSGVQRVEARLPQPARLRVRVTGPDGAFLAGAHVHCLSAGGQALNFFSTKGSNAKGVVELSGLPPGPQRFLARHPQVGSAEFEVVLQAGELAKHEVVIGAGVRLEISVTDAEGAPMSGVLAVAMEPGGRPLFYFTVEESQTINQAWFSGGAQPVGPLAPGRYVIRLHRPGYPPVDHAVTVAPAPPVQSLRLRFAPPE